MHTLTCTDTCSPPPTPPCIIEEWASLCSLRLRTPLFQFCHCRNHRGPFHNANAAELGLMTRATWTWMKQKPLLRVKAKAGLIGRSLPASVGAKRDKQFPAGPRGGGGAVGESSSPPACIPSISCTASWTGIRKQIPTVISQQQRGCYIVWTWGLCAGYVCCKYKVSPPGAFSSQVSPRARWLKYWTGSWIFHVSTGIYAELSTL